MTYTYILPGHPALDESCDFVMSVRVMQRRVFIFYIYYIFLVRAHGIYVITHVDRTTAHIMLQLCIIVHLRPEEWMIQHVRFVRRSRTREINTATRNYRNDKYVIFYTNGNAKFVFVMIWVRLLQHHRCTSTRKFLIVLQTEWNSQSLWNTHRDIIQ